MNIVVSDPKTGKAYTKKLESAEALLNKKIGDEVELDPLGIEGYSAKITGGSDKQGFPMKADLKGTMRKKVMLTDKKTGTRNKVSRRGNTITEETSQVNLAVTKYGKRDLPTVMGPQIKEEKVSEKEIVRKEFEAALTGK